MVKSRKFRMIIWILTVILIFGFIYQYPRKKNISLKGYELPKYSVENSYHREIVLNLIIKRNIFKKDQYKGSVIIGDMEFVISEYHDIGIESGLGRNIIKYDNGMDTKFWGTFYLDDNLENTIIGVHQKEKFTDSYSKGAGSVIIGSVDEINSIKKFTNNLLSSTSFNEIKVD